MSPPGLTSHVSAILHHRSADASRTSTTSLLCVDDVCFDNIAGATALEIIQRYLDDPEPRSPRIVFFVNVHSIHIARRNAGLHAALHRADLVLPDGAGLALAGKVYNRPVSENLNGTDFVPRVLQRLAASGQSVYLLGATRPVLDACLRRIPALFPGLRVAGARHGHFAEAEEPDIIASINAAAPDVLLVAMGTPAQENWIVRHQSRLRTRVCFGVGGLFDFLSGEKRRAPGWMRRAGLEWAFRFLHAPNAKWDRVLLEIPLFLTRTLLRRITVTSLPIPSHRVGAPVSETED